MTVQTDRRHKNGYGFFFFFFGIRRTWENRLIGLLRLVTLMELNRYTGNELIFHNA